MHHMYTSVRLHFSTAVNEESPSFSAVGFDCVRSQEIEDTFYNLKVWSVQSQEAPMSAVK